MVLTIIGIVALLLVASIGSASIQQRIDAKALSDMQAKRDEQRERAERAERYAYQFDAEAQQLSNDYAKVYAAWEKAEERANMASSQVHHMQELAASPATVRVEPANRAAITAEVIEPGLPIIDQIGPMPELDTSITCGWRLPAPPAAPRVGAKPLTRKQRKEMARAGQGAAS